MKEKTIEVDTRKRKRAAHEISEKWIKRALDIFGVEITVEPHGGCDKLMKFFCVEDSNREIAQYLSKSNNKRPERMYQINSRLEYKFPEHFKSAKDLKHFIMRGGLRETTQMMRFGMVQTGRTQCGSENEAAVGKSEPVKTPDKDPPTFQEQVVTVLRDSLDQVKTEFELKTDPVFKDQVLVLLREIRDARSNPRKT